MNNILKQIENLKIQLQHVITNNIDDINYEDQITHIENQIKNLEIEEYYSNIDNSKSIIEKIYQYKGPMYKFNTYIGESNIIETKAKTLKKAKSNIIYRLKILLDLPVYSNLSIDESKIKEVN